MSKHTPRSFVDICSGCGQEVHIRNMDEYCLNCISARSKRVAALEAGVWKLEEAIHKIALRVANVSATKPDDIEVWSKVELKLICEAVSDICHGVTAAPAGKEEK